MCGICGTYSLHTSIEAPWSIIPTMNAQLVHRGPDEEGYYRHSRVCFGMRRLKVIDLVSGSQPIFNEDKSIVVVCNGEIYNYKALRRELVTRGHTFYSNGDIEVIPHLYEEKGEDFVHALNGDFAIALWDLRAQRVLLVRDRLGVKPLFYMEAKGVLYFASEIKALLAVPEMCRELDYRAFDLYMSLSYIPAPKTIFKRIKRVLPGHMITSVSGKYAMRRYWSTEESRVTPRISSEQECVEIADELLSSSVRLRLNSDVPIGLLLSSGIDSSAIAYYASKLSEHRLKTYTVTFKEASFNEGQVAKEVADFLGTQHTESRLDANIHDVIEKLPEYFDEPFGDYSCIPTHAISKRVSQDVTVALSGDGGDEVFGGYPTYYAYQLYRYYVHLPEGARKRLLPWLAKLLPTSHKRISFDYKVKQFVIGAQYPYPHAHFIWRGYFVDGEKEGLYSDSLKCELRNRSGLDMYMRYLPNFNTRYESMNDLMNIDIASLLTNEYNTKVDMMSMAHSLEVRSPFLDYRLVEFSQTVAEHLKVRGFRTKYILRHLLKSKLPQSVFGMPKRGFTIPLASWLHGPLRYLCREVLAAKNLRHTELFSEGYVTSLIDEHMARKKDNNRKLWLLISFMLWYKHFIK